MRLSTDFYKPLHLGLAWKLLAMIFTALILLVVLMTCMEPMRAQATQCQVIIPIAMTTNGGWGSESHD